jgi:hypothetical protein
MLLTAAVPRRIDNSGTRKPWAGEVDQFLDQQQAKA